ncbi:MAG TPA: hypothetical protein GX708_11680 [Gallicola sp.]|nr:hypothetical protein [Gallicola sp.]
MNYFVYVDGVLAVKTNAKKFAWSYGTVAPLSTMEKYDKCMIKINIDVRSSNKVFNNDIEIDKMGKYHYFYANKDENKIYYERNFFLKNKLRYSIELNGNEINVIVSKNYMKYIKHRIMGLHSISYILTDITAGLLLKNGIATIHCSAVNKGEKTIIIFAPPNTGKTLTSIQLCKEHKFKFIAEDFALTDGENVWAVPWTSTFRYYDDINESKVDRAVNKITKLFPFIELISVRKNKSIDNYLGRDSIKHFSKATDIVVLERGVSSVERDKSEGLRKISNLNKYEFNYIKAPSIVVMNYYIKGFSPEEMYETEKNILSKLIKNCNYVLVSEGNALNYADVILNEVIEK